MSKGNVQVGKIHSNLKEFEHDDSPEMQDQMGDFPPADPQDDMGMTDDPNAMGDEERGEPCPACNPDGQNEEGMEGCEVCGGLGFLPPEDGQEHEDELSGTEDSAEMDQDPVAPSGQGQDHNGLMFMNKGACRPCSYMKKEDTIVDEDSAFMKSLLSQTRYEDQKNSSGLDEEMLIAMGEKEPAPGDVGFAPQGKLGELGGGFKMDDFKELPVLGQ